MVSLPFYARAFFLPSMWEGFSSSWNFPPSLLKREFHSITRCTLRLLSLAGQTLYLTLRFESSFTVMKDKAKCIAFYGLFGAILINFFLKGVLLLARYGLSSKANACEQQEAENGSAAAAGSSSVSHEFILTTAVYGVLSVLRFLEYLILAAQFYRFLFIQEEPNFLGKHPKRYYYLLLFSVILLPYFLLGIIIPALGIYQELEQSMHLEECYQHDPEVYITYCVINFFRYMSAYAVRIVFIFTTLAISKFWFPEHEGVPAHTSSGHMQFDVQMEEVSKSIENGSKVIEAVDKCALLHFVDRDTIGSNLHDGESDDSPRPVSNIECNIPDASVGNDREKNALIDWKEVSEDFMERAIAYNKIGNQVLLIQDLFQTWFILPWIVYLMASSLKTYNILRPWNLDGDGNSPPSDIPQLYYLLYNANQFITLLIPFLCAKKINTYHQKYYKLMRESQLKKFWDKPSRLSLARQLYIEKKGKFDFVPRIWGTQVSINIRSPLYIILLLAGLFLSVTKSLLKN